MSEQAHYCPFLNRSDARCSTNFSLEQLGNTYDFCFGQYAACPTYMELLVERRLRRQKEAALLAAHPSHNHAWAAAAHTVQLTHAGRPV